MYRFVSSRRLDRRFSQPCWAGGQTAQDKAPRAVAGIRAASGDSNIEVAKLSKAARYLKLRIRLMFSAGNGEHSARAAPRNHHLSDQGPFGERDELTAGDDEVVERADVDQPAPA